ncbi:hypothetical protein Mapa_002118 [Marchantia paleacea]|nr:hypothetical protein Mapa_002118 [Marchantia paleacea]
MSDEQFGAPPICNSKAGEYLSHIIPVEDLFLNYINDGDSVPVLLNNLEEVRKEAKLSASHQLMAKIQRVSNLLSLLAVELQPSVLEELTEIMVEIGSCFPKTLLSMEAIQLQGGRSEHHYCPFGKYWRLQRQADDSLCLPLAIRHSNISQSAVSLQPESFQTTRPMQPKLLEELSTKNTHLKTSVQITTAYGSTGDLFPIFLEWKNLASDSRAISTLNAGIVKSSIMSEALRKMSINEVNKQHMKQLRLKYHMLLDALLDAADLAGLKVEFEDVVLGFEKPNLELLAKQISSDSFLQKAREALCDDFIDLLSGLESGISDETALKLVFAVQHVRHDEYQSHQIVHRLARYLRPWLGTTSEICPPDGGTGCLRARGRLDSYEY